MSEFINEAVAQLNEKMKGQDIGGTAKIVVEDEGAIMLDGSGARAADEDADVTMTASKETFQAIFEGEENPTAAFMGGKLTVDGDMGMAMQLAGVL